MHQPLGYSGLKHPPLLRLKRDLCAEREARFTEEERKSGTSWLGQLATRKGSGILIVFQSYL